MKMTVLLLTTICLQISAKTVSQTITLTEKDAPLKKVFAKIEKQTGYHFLYRYEWLKDARNVTIDVKNASLQQVLDACFKEQPFTYVIFEKTISIQRKQLQPETVAPPPLLDISGRVLNEKNEPIEGVNISVKGTGRMTTTNEKGEFSIKNISTSATLVFSSIGYARREIVLNGNTQIEVTMQIAASNLVENVVVAYGRQKKTTLTGAVATLSGTELVKAPMPNITNALVGKLPGLIAFNTTGQPGNDNATLLVRGLSTLGDNSPLIVIDGIPRSSFAYMDANDIESISMLKDASAVAQFGSRAANGVILVTTKRGAEGKVSISYTANVGFQRPTMLIESLDSFQTALAWNEAKKNEGVFNPSPGGVNGYDDATLEIIRNGSNPDRYANVDWYNTIFNTKPLQTSHNLSVTGGSNAMRYFVSAGYMDQEGLYPAAYFKRYNLRANLDGAITNNLQFSLNMAGRVETNNGFYTYTNSSSGFGEFGFGNGIVTAALYTPNIEPIQYSNGFYHYNSSSAGNMYLTSKGEGGYNKTTNNILESSVSLIYKFPFVKGLAAKGLLAIDKSFIFKKSLSKPYTSYILNDDGTFTGRLNTQTTSISETFLQAQSITAEASLQYDRNFNRHNIKVLLLYSQTQNQGDNFSAGRNNLPTASLDQLDLGSSATATNTGTGYQNARKSLVGKLGYNYASKYLLDFSFRYDGSDVFPPGHRYGFFPAISAGWLLSEESFFVNNIKFVDYLKLRGSYGQAGNDRVGQFQYLQTYTASGVYAFGGTAANSVQALVPGVIPNSNFTWERATISNIGFEASVLKGKLNVEADYFYKRTKDILVPLSTAIPAVLGGTAPLQNAGIVDSRGVEIAVTYQQRTKKLQYALRPTLTLSRSKVITYPEPAGITEWLKKTGKPVSIDALQGYQAAGLYQSEDEITKGPTPLYPNVKPGDIKYADIDGNGKIDANDRIIITRGSTPGTIFGMNASIGFKNFELAIFFQGASDVTTYLAAEISKPFYGNNQKLYSFQTDRWALDNKEAKYPRLTITSPNNSERSSFWVFNSSYLRLKNIELAYTLTNKILSKTKIQNIRVFANASNLITFSGLKIVDPESGASAIGYPVMKIWNTGLMISL